MRRIRYQVAASLDGYIAGPNGEADWIILDPDIDFAALFNQFDTFLMGRGTFEGMLKQQGSGATPGKQTLVFSRTLRQQDHPDVTIVAADPEKALTDLRKKPGKDIWLFGGGIPLLPAPASQTKLKLTGHRVYEKTGIVLLEYAIDYARRPKAKAKTSKATR